MQSLYPDFKYKKAVSKKEYPIQPEFLLPGLYYGSVRFHSNDIKQRVVLWERIVEKKKGKGFQPHILEVAGEIEVQLKTRLQYLQ